MWVVTLLALKRWPFNWVIPTTESMWNSLPSLIPWELAVITTGSAAVAADMLKDEPVPLKLSSAVSYPTAVTAYCSVILPVVLAEEDKFKGNACSGWKTIWDNVQESLPVLINSWGGWLGCVSVITSADCTYCRSYNCAAVYGVTIS